MKPAFFEEVFLRLNQQKLVTVSGKEKLEQMRG